MTNFINANETTLPILADASDALIAATTKMLETGILPLSMGNTLNRDERRNLLTLRDHIISI